MDTSEPSDTIRLDRILEELRQLRKENSQLREETARIIALLDGTAPKKRKNEAVWRSQFPRLETNMMEWGYLTSRIAHLSSSDWDRAKRALQRKHPDWIEEDLGRMGKVLRLPTTPIERIRSGMINPSSSPVESDQKREDTRIELLRQWDRCLSADRIKGAFYFNGFLTGPGNIHLIRDAGFQLAEEVVEWCKDQKTKGRTEAGVQ